MISVLKVKYIRHFLHAINRRRVYCSDYFNLLTAYRIYIPYTQWKCGNLILTRNAFIQQDTIRAQKLKNQNPNVFEEICMYTFNTAYTADSAIYTRSGILNLILYWGIYDFIHSITWENDAECDVIINHMYLARNEKEVYFVYPLPLYPLTIYGDPYFIFTKHTRVSIVASKLVGTKKFKTSDTHKRIYSALPNALDINPHTLIKYYGCLAESILYDLDHNEECECATNQRFLQLLPEIQASNLKWASIPIEQLREYTHKK